MAQEGRAGGGRAGGDGRAAGKDGKGGEQGGAGDERKQGVAAPVVRDGMRATVGAHELRQQCLQALEGARAACKVRYRACHVVLRTGTWAPWCQVVVGWEGPLAL